MVKSPDFLKAFSDFNTNKSYRLIQLNRSGERTAWLSVLALGILDVVLLSRLGSISVAAFIFSILLLLAASAISVSNYLERNTSITVTESGLVYQRLMRKVALTWKDINSLMVTQRGAGWYVMVVGDQRVFTFQTPTSIKGPIGREARTGIESGEQLAAMIASRAHLGELEREGDVWICRRERSEKSV